MKTRRLVSVLLIAIMVFSATACSGKSKVTDSKDTGNKAEGSNAAGGGSEEVTEIRFAEWDGGNTLEVYEEIAEQFNKSQSKIHVTVMNIPDEYDTKITTMVAGNDAPEICEMEAGTLMYPYAEEGIVLNMLDFINKDTDFDKNCMLDQFKYMLTSDYMAGYASGSENITMFYNPSLFQKYGIEEPPASYKDAWDWDTFVNVAQRLTIDKKGRNALDPDFDPKNIETYGVTISKWWAGYMPFLYSLGGDYLNEDGTSIGYATEQGIDALQKLADLTFKYHVAPTPTASETMPGASEALTTNKVAMTFDGQWMNAALMADGVAYNVAALPKMGDKAKTTMTFSGISIMNTDKADAAWEFEKYILSKGSCDPLYKSGLWLPTTANEYTDEYIKSFITDKHPKNYFESIVAPMMDGTAERPVVATIKNFNKINDIISPALDLLWSGEMTAADAIASIKDQANAEVKGYLGK
ncbi:multiple sugar transport system substrate-binding protein [Anaerocolumna jejuensis DSM 15929]|uniref:Multiple sugar transport system substrate-binding protein n=1 Tax=Anaerocolumna jejuensis DSM 15929 TaxID=1121322 RepID=A0A1M6KCN2_9FIRM|nr:sugar ABC transporter substrate-binding protein [Anaerocolumna jejuensis]SHJ56685.1 multiple sugar transport system substrate-binding protein [Anaerocolumna jejuensis DSM 15929]